MWGIGGAAEATDRGLPALRKDRRVGAGVGIAGDAIPCVKGVGQRAKTGDGDGLFQKAVGGAPVTIVSLEGAR